MIALLLALLAIVPRVREGDVQSFTSLTDAQGKALAQGKYLQRVEGDVLHVEARYDFPDGRSIVERASLRLHPHIEQLTWDWIERNGAQLVRQYEIDFSTRKAVATRVDQHKRWKEDVEIEPGKTFAGIAFVAVIKSLRAELEPGQKVELKVVAFTPKPRVASVDVIRVGLENVRIAGRTLSADHYTIHPGVPAIAKLFVKAPDQQVWLFGSSPAAFLRYQGPLAEPSDPTIRVDLIPSRSANLGRKRSAGSSRHR